MEAHLGDFEKLPPYWEGKGRYFSDKVLEALKEL